MTNDERSAAELIAEARRQLWWFIETYTDEDEDTVARAMSIQDELLYPALEIVRRLVVERDAAERQAAAQRDLRKLADARSAEYTEMAESAQIALAETFKAGFHACWHWEYGDSRGEPDHAPISELFVASTLATTEGVASEEVSP